MVVGGWVDTTQNIVFALGEDLGWRLYKNIDAPKYKDDLENEDHPKNEDVLRSDPKYGETSESKTTRQWKMTSKRQASLNNMAQA